MLDRKTLIKNFTIGFLPLLIFIAADEAFGLTVGLIVAIVFGVGQFLFTWIKEKRLDAFILFDTGLILVLGLISIVLHNDIFFKVKPGLVEFILVVLLAITGFSNNPILVKMTGRYMKGIEFNDAQIQMMQRMMRRMFFVFLLHTVLIFYAAFFLSKEAWAFISGGLFYILMGGIVAVEFVKSKWQQRKFNREYGDDEWFDIVTPEGKITGKAPRKMVHGNPNLLHPVVHLHIINANTQLYLQKRAANKQIQPDKWDTAVGGHVASGESIEFALKREAGEELGISFGEFKPLYRYIMQNEIESELVHTFLFQDNGPFYPDPTEISEGKFWELAEIEEQLGSGVFTPNFEQEFVMLMKVLFQKEIAYTPPI